KRQPACRSSRGSTRSLYVLEFGLKWIAALAAVFLLGQGGEESILLAKTGTSEMQTAPAQASLLENRIPLFYVSAYLTNPQIVSVSLISGFTMRGSADHSEGIFFELEPGIGGGKLSVGHANVGAHGMHWNWKGAVLRTWGDPWGMHANE